MRWRALVGALGALAIGALGAYIAWLNRIVDLSPSLHPYQVAHGVIPAPHWLAPALKALPRRHLTASERDTFRREGAILLKGLIPDRNITSLLDEKLGDKKGMLHNLWIINGIVHSLVKHGPLAELSASALDVPEVTLWNTQLEPRPARSERTWPLAEKPWYDPLYGDPRDQSVHEDTDYYMGDLHRAGHFVKPQASIYLALTDIPHGLELLAGSHVSNQRHGCGRRLMEFPHFAACMDRLERDSRGVVWWDLEPGDAILFYGSVFHWTVLQERPRKALSIRYVPADMMYTGGLVDLMPGSYVNWKCGPIGGCPAFPIFYSNDSSRMKDQPWPLWSKNKDTSPVVLYLRELLLKLDWRCNKIFEM